MKPGSIAKICWNVAEKEYNLWVKQVNSIFIKNEGWWEYRPSNDTCWYWKKICTIKEKFKQGVHGNCWLKESGKYIIRSGYKWLSGAGSEWPWSRGVWSRTTIAKHGFISWIAMHGKVVDKGEDDKDET